MGMYLFSGLLMKNRCFVGRALALGVWGARHPSLRRGAGGGRVGGRGRWRSAAWWRRGSRQGHGGGDDGGARAREGGVEALGAL